jgi:hypothetical protein
MANANGFKNYNAYVKHLDTEKEIDELLKTGAQGDGSQMTDEEFNDRVEGLGMGRDQEQGEINNKEGNGEQIFGLDEINGDSFSKRMAAALAGEQYPPEPSR